MRACICSVIFLIAVFTQNVNASESDLRRNLFENYDKLVRPVRDSSHAVPVWSGIFPVGIKDVDVKEKIVKLDSWLFVKWHDEYLSWNPTEHGGLSTLRLPAAEVWKPDLTIYFATPDTNLQPMVHTNVVIYPNGTVLWVPPFTFKSRCNESETSVDEESFNCTLSLGSWTYDANLLDIQEYVRDFDELIHDAYQDTHPNWSLNGMETTHEVKFYACCTEPYPILKVKLSFKKKHI